MITAKVVADSLNQQGNRLTTMLITFPRIILAELNTHRMLSKNSASSRAIPLQKIIASVKNNPFIPLAWQKDHTGMQGSEYFTDLENDIPALESAWLCARDSAIESAVYLNKCFENEDGSIEGLTKQQCNRLLEPFMMHTVLISGTEWENFFNLRCPQYRVYAEQVPRDFRSKKDVLKFVHDLESPEFKAQYDDLTELDWLQCNKGQAEIHMMALAEAMWDALNESTPKELKAGEWHIPFGDKIDITDKFAWDNSTGELIEAKIKIATARCARVSYTVIGEEGKEPNYENDIKLHDRLAESKHWSPFEHCAKAMTDKEYYSYIKGIRWMNGTVSMFGAGAPFGWCRNFKGFIQYRELIESEKHN